MSLINRHNFISSLALALLITVYIANYTITTIYEPVIHSGIASTMEEAAGVIKGFGRLLDSLKSIIDIISGIITPEVLILFIAASFIGFGLSFLGVPKGGASFLCSIFIADILWFIWAKSFNPEFPDLVKKIFSIIKTNLIIIIPFIVVYFFRARIFSKKLMPKIVSFFKSIFKRKKLSGLFDKKEIAEITAELNDSISMLQRSVLNDILAQNDKDKIKLSEDTLKRRKELEGILNKFEKTE